MKLVDRSDIPFNCELHIIENRTILHFSEENACAKNSTENKMEKVQLRTRAKKTGDDICSQCTVRPARLA